MKKDSRELLTIPRFMIAAPGSGSGKTLVTCGLLRFLQRRGFRPAAFKCGPDYIDPMFHRKVLGIPSENLDTFFSPDGAVRNVLMGAVQDVSADIAVIEGVMGYYDGTGSSGLEASSFDLAEQTDTPVILVVNARGMARSIVPLLQGFAAYEAPERKIRGVILNCVSRNTAARMKQWIEDETDLRMAGFLPRDSRFSWGSRHLGLLQPEELKDLDRQVDLIADVMEETVDLEALLDIAGSDRKAAERIPADKIPEDRTPAGDDRKNRPAPGDGGPDDPVIAVARDEAFSFYYEDNLRLLKEAGARIVFFSPLHDDFLPEADGLLIGGGYPELHAERLASNLPMKEAIRRRAEEGIPILAECGGFMYLQEYLEVPGTGGKEEAGLFRMCGVLPGTCRRTERLVRFGYLELTGNTAGYLSEGHRIRGHEFHYYDSTDNGAACRAERPGKAVSWECMTVRGNIMAGFPHLYYRSDPAFAALFVQRCREYRVKT